MFDLKGFGKPLETSSPFRDIDINRFLWLLIPNNLVAGRTKCDHRPIKRSETKIKLS